MPGVALDEPEAVRAYDGLHRGPDVGQPATVEGRPQNPCLGRPLDQVIQAAAQRDCALIVGMTAVVHRQPAITSREPGAVGADEFAQFLKADTVSQTELLKLSGVKPE